MIDSDIDAVASLQAAAFPPPFSPDLLWNLEHLEKHIRLFPHGQWVAESEGQIVGSCSNTLIGSRRWDAHESWSKTVGGPMLETFDRNGSTLYGLDITVHPDFRQRGIGREFYEQRFRLVRALDLVRYGTGCRMPGFTSSGVVEPAQYATEVVAGQRTDRVLSTLLRYNLTFLQTIENYMEDEESGNAAALLEWRP